MKLQYSSQSIFESTCEAWVNPVNTMGVMGAGLALGFKTRFPAMFSEYARLCEIDGLIPGRCYVYEETSPAKYPSWIVNFTSKDNWKEPSRLVWIEEGLEDLEAVIDYYKIKSVALPLIGAGLGRCDPVKVEQMISAFSERVPCKVVLHKVKL